jgi:hypothetical protein
MGGAMKEFGFSTDVGVAIGFCKLVQANLTWEHFSPDDDFEEPIKKHCMWLDLFLVRGSPLGCAFCKI